MIGELVLRVLDRLLSDRAGPILEWAFFKTNVLLFARNVVAKKPVLSPVRPIKAEAHFIVKVSAI